MSMEQNRVEVSAGFLLLAAWLNYWDRQGVFPQVLLACVLHELGHLLALRWLRVPVEKLRVTAVGAELRIAGSLSYRGELAAALAGPAVNLVLAGWLSGMPGGAVGAGGAADLPDERGVAERGGDRGAVAGRERNAAAGIAVAGGIHVGIWQKKREIGLAKGERSG